MNNGRAGRKRRRADKDDDDSKEQGKAVAIAAVADDDGNMHENADAPNKTRAKARKSVRESAENKSDADKTRENLQREFQELHEEMAVAQYGRTRSGQVRRELPRHLRPERTQKRKALESRDRIEFAVEGEYVERRVRGSMAAAERDIVEASQVFHTPIQHEMIRPSGDDSGSSEGEEEPNDGENGEMEESDDDEDEEGGEGAEQIEAAGETETTQQPDAATTTTPRKKKSGSRRTKASRTKRLYRLRNFKSYKLAQRHGDAIGALVRGQPNVAIAKLKDVAKDAPSAPQVYSSLGMIYEDMLRSSQRKLTERSAAENGNDAPDVESLVNEQIDLGKKAYGSYHASAVLCKRDYTLWVRAADMALVIADLHDDMLQLPGASESIQEKHRSEKAHWLKEALNDYKSADNLRAPGIDVPCKLASLMMELGMLSEALTCMTDLKNRGPPSGGRTEFDASYNGWILYSNLMLRIGHECVKWNNKDHSNENYMFRRWLRKWSVSFDWQGRRVQALARALEAAAGSHCTKEFVVWMKKRAADAEKKVSQEAAQDATEEVEGNETDMQGVEVNETDSPQNTATGRDPGIDLSQQGDDENEIKLNMQGLGSNDTDTSPDEGVLDAGAEPSERDNDEKKTELDMQGIEVNEPDSPQNTGTGRDARIEPSEQVENTTKESELSLQGLDSSGTCNSQREAGLGAPLEPSGQGNNNEEETELDMQGLESLGQGNDEDATTEELVAQVVAETIHAANESWETSSPDEELPLSASAKTVCALAADLMRSLIENKEDCDGVRLVGEAVSLYFRERAKRRDRREQSRVRFLAQQQQTDGVFAFQKADYDNIGDGEYISDSDELLSDEEDDGSDNWQVLDSFYKKGVLPPTLLYFYGLGLAGLGGRDFLAAKCIRSVLMLEQEDKSWFDSQIKHREANAEDHWRLFELRKVGEVGRTQGLSIVADVLRTLDLEKRFLGTLVDIFTQHEKTLVDTGVIDLCIEMNPSECPTTEYKQGIVVACIDALINYKTQYFDLSQAKREVDDALPSLMDSVSIISSLLPSFWLVENDKSLSRLRQTTLSTLSSAYSVLVAEAENKSDKVSMEKLIGSLSPWISSICSEDADDLLSRPEAETTAQRLDELPMSAEFQSSGQFQLSLRCYNLAVARNVADFSGWEPQEFGVITTQIRRRAERPFYGITSADGQVAGYLAPRFVSELVAQWNLIAATEKVVPAGDLSSRLTAVSSDLWFAELGDKILEFEGTNQIQQYAEEDALRAMLSFSRLSILLLQKGTSWLGKDGQLLGNALSVLMPLTQFCLNQRIWDCRLGTEASAGSPEEWRRLVLATDNASVTRPKKKFLKPSQNQEAESKKKFFIGWFAGEDCKEPLKNLIAVSRSRTAGLWKKIATEKLNCSTSKTASEAMQSVHKKLCQLRKSFTEEAAERASIQVASALIELATWPECEGFAIIQHAALFAGHGSKRGSNDLFFKKKIPEKENLTPHEAIVIIGRANCMAEIYFTLEAAFLCGFIASVCHLHRKPKDGTLDEKWNIVSILNYNTSVMIRYTAMKLQEGKSSYSWWDNNTMRAELNRSRSEGLRWSCDDKLIYQPNDLFFDPPEQGTPPDSTQGFDLDQPPRQAEINAMTQPNLEAETAVQQQPNLNDEINAMHQQNHEADIDPSVEVVEV